MRIVIVGAGLTGTQLAKHLVQEKHDVSLIEADEETARHASNRLDCLVLHDDGDSIKSLEEAGIAKADALVCLTSSDEKNMIICGLAASRYPHLIKIARVRNDEYTLLGQNAKILGIDFFVHPDVEAAREVLNALPHGASGNILRFPGTPYELGSVNIEEGSTLDGLILSNFHSVAQKEGLIPLVEREQESFLPSGSTILKAGDRVHIIAREEDMNQVFRLAGRTGTPLRRIGIVGGGRLGSLVAEGLLTDKSDHAHKTEKSLSHLFRSLIPKSSRRVIIIEQNYGVCKELSARFPDALVLNDDISDENFIAEERIGELDLIITATANQDLNIITAIYLKTQGVRRAIALVSSSGHEAIAHKLGVDVAIPVKSVVVDSVLSHLMGKGIQAIHSLGDGIGIIEAEISPDSPIAEKAITEFKLSGGGLVLLVNRKERSFIPRGDYVFKPEDKVIIIAKNSDDVELEKFLGSSK
ncbi:MAG: Trk system potassium transport protein TrkA [Treponema sp.]|jgi:trk system potassium uptake protein TrkA|nr:Trk system potassium transport protein TrkA [Treponema sp.]